MLVYLALGGGVLVLLALGVVMVVLAVLAGFLATKKRSKRAEIPAAELQPAAFYSATEPEPVPPGEALIGAFEVAGKRRAGALIEDQLGAAKAAEVVGSITRAFAPEAPSARPARGGG